MECPWSAPVRRRRGAGRTAQRCVLYREAGRPLDQNYCIDRNRVFATGFSGGARMASQLACDASKIFAAVAPVSGLRFPSPCPSTRAVPVAAFHGTADPVDPYAGHGQKYWTYSVPVAAGRWAVHNRCSKSAANSLPATGVDGPRTPTALTVRLSSSTRSSARATSGPGDPTYPRRSPRRWVPRARPSAPMPYVVVLCGSPAPLTPGPSVPTYF